MLEHIVGIPKRLTDLQRKLAARKGKAEFKENVPALKAEIARLEAVTTTREALTEFLEENETMASPDDQQDSA